MSAPQQATPTHGMDAMMAMFQQFLKAQTESQKYTTQLLQAQSQTMAASAPSRKIQTIDKLTKQEDFPVWRDDIFRVLKRVGLEGYITSDVPAPEGEAAKVQWNIDRADVEEYIRAMVPGQRVWSLIKGMGWNPREGDPKKTYDMVAKYFEQSSSDSNVKMAQELANIRRSKFGKMEAFQVRVNYLRDRLNDTAFKMSDDAYIWFCLKGIEKEYSSLYDRMVNSMESGNLTWGDLMIELQCLAVSKNA